MKWTLGRYLKINCEDENSISNVTCYSQCSCKTRLKHKQVQHIWLLTVHIGDVTAMPVADPWFSQEVQDENWFQGPLKFHSPLQNKAYVIIIYVAEMCCSGSPKVAPWRQMGPFLGPKGGAMAPWRSICILSKWHKWFWTVSRSEWF